MLKNYFSLVLIFSFLFNNLSAQDSIVTIPDPNFEQALIDLGIDSDGIVNQSILYSDAQNVDVLDISSRNIIDLTGIEAFSELISLDCQNNEITDSGFSISSQNFISLNISGNKMTTFVIQSISSKLRELDISNNPNLINLSVYTHLYYETNINASQNPKLKTIICNQSYLEYINISQCPALEELDLANNQLTYIDLSSHLNLKILDLSQNNFTNLDVSKNISLNAFNCFANMLTSLDMRNGNNSLLRNFDAGYNDNLTCILVDNAFDANAYNKWYIDTNAEYRSESCYFDIQISTDKTVLAENGELAIITATLNEVSPSSDVIINLAVSGTAPSSNYELSSNTIVIPAGQLSASISLTALEDEMDADKTVII